MPGEILVVHAFSFLPLVSEVPTEPVQGNEEAIVVLLIFQAKQPLLADSHTGLLRKEHFATMENSS